MVGDLFHAGHVALLRKARRHGDWLIVGVLSDETAASYKRRRIMSLAERVAVIESCRYVDEVIEDAPFELTDAFLREHDITTVVHGDDLTSQGAEAVYGAAAAAGKLTLVPRTADVADPEYGDRLFVHDRSSLFRLPAGGIVRATNPAPTTDPSFAAGRGNRGNVSRFCRASPRAGVARLSRSARRAENSPIPSLPRSAVAMRGAFCG
jgi:cytidyltransferase-like protein